MGTKQETRESRIPWFNKEPEQKLPVSLRETTIVFNAEDDLSPKQKSRLKKAGKKVANATKRLAEGVGRLATAGTILAVTNYGITHSNLQTTRDESGTITYRHEDPLTTHYLNVIAGREEFTMEDRLREYRPFVKFKAEKENLPLPKDIEKMSIGDLDSFIYNNPSFVEQGTYKKYAKETAGGRNVRSMTDPERKIIYELVWKLEQEAGNPRIRFTAEDINSFFSYGSEDGDHYGQFDNIIYVHSYDFVYPHKGVMDEMSHAKQFNSNPIGSHLKSVREFISVVIRGGFSRQKIKEKYAESYDTPGSIEHDAHEIIEPYLEEKYPLP